MRGYTQLVHEQRYQIYALMKADHTLYPVSPSWTVIPPLIIEFKSRSHAASANFCIGVIPPSAEWGRSLL